VQIPWIIEVSPPTAAMASALRQAIFMKRTGVLKIIFILAGALLLAQCRPPTPVAATVEFAPEVGADGDQVGHQRAGGSGQ